MAGEVYSLKNPVESSRLINLWTSIDLFPSGLFQEDKCAKCVHETVRDKWSLHKWVLQTENGLECGFVKHWQNSDCFQFDNSLWCYSENLVLIENSTEVIISVEVKKKSGMVLQKCTTPELENSEKYKIRQLESLNTTGRLISSL